jgi:peptide/nickel transport system substrate-binding protein
MKKREAMKLFDWRWLAISSLLVGALAADAESRPQYGGVLRVAMRAAPTSLDPADSSQSDSFARRSLTMQLFDTLVTYDENERVQASLAASWQASPDKRRWQFRLHSEVTLHDGTLLTAETVAASLRTANPSWKVYAEAQSVVIERDGSDAELLSALALPRNAIVKRNSDNKLAGTGPFRIDNWQPGKMLTLVANNDCWRGRPFLDSIEIEMGRSFRDQMTAMDLGKADLVEVAPDQTHRISLDGRRLANSAPMELLALAFARDVASPEEKMLREALAWSMERSSMRSVLLQGAGQPAASILPNWMTGYGFVFSTDVDLQRARQAREEVHTAPTWTIGYDSSDPLDRLLVERVALNAKDVGLSLQPTSSATADLRLVRIPLAAADPWSALADVAVFVGLPTPTGTSNSVENLYAVEQALLATKRIVPLFHLPLSYAGSIALKNWTLHRDGNLSLADAWLENARP